MHSQVAFCYPLESAAERVRHSRIGHVRGVREAVDTARPSTRRGTGRAAYSISMRLFTAIDLPPDVLGNLERLLARLRPAARIKWVAAANIHLTTKFIGEWPDERLEELTAALGGLPRREPIDIALRGLGFFPNARAPRVFWVGVEAPPGVAELAGETDRALGRLGVPPENRPFSPHLTLARIKEPVPLEALRLVIEQLPSVEFGQFRADRFYLYRSQLTPSGSVYTRLSEFRL